jgi:hypothetical protein
MSFSEKGPKMAFLGKWPKMPKMPKMPILGVYPKTAILRLRGVTPKEGSIWQPQFNVLLGVFSIFFIDLRKTLKNNHLYKSLIFSQFHI